MTVQQRKGRKKSRCLKLKSFELTCVVGCKVILHKSCCEEQFLWKINLTDNEQLLSAVYSCFKGQFKKKSSKNSVFSISTKMLHKMEVIFFFIFLKNLIMNFRYKHIQFALLFARLMYNDFCGAYHHSYHTPNKLC